MTKAAEIRNLKMANPTLNNKITNNAINIIVRICMFTHLTKKIYQLQYNIIVIHFSIKTYHTLGMRLTSSQD